jgi:hypothetical protein
MDRVRSFGLALTDADQATMRRFHDEFARSGLDIQYTTTAGRMWRPMPANRELYLATDLEGHQRSYLATEDRWRVVRDLERRDRVVPVVGDLSGPHAIRAIGRYLAETKRQVSVFYLSNVEQYLFRNGVFPAFVANVRTLPAKRTSLLVRSVLGRGWSGGPGYTPTLASRQRAQTFPRFLELTGKPDSVDYGTLISDAIEIRLQPAGTPPGRP